MTHRRWPIIFVSLLVAVSISYMSYRAGVNITMERGAYAATIPIREEQKCFDSKDIECLRMHWNMRVGITAEVARKALKSTLPSTVEAELKAYVEWAEQIQPYQPPQKR